MGKSYIESSLKRFLKRKVKITLGVVVTFLITGMISFGADKPVEEMNDFEKAEHYLQGRGTNSLEIGKKTYENTSGNGNQKITVSDDNGNINLKFEGFADRGPKNPIITIKNEYISSITKPIIETSFSNAITALEKGEIVLNSSKNNGIINGGNNQGIGMFNGKNNGLVLSQYGMSGNGINNGIIIFSTYGMYSGDVTNNGILIGTTNTASGQVGLANKVVTNNGIIIKVGNGQYNQQAGKVKLLNYGVIDANIGQNLSGASKSIVNNYGIIFNGTGQHIINYNKDSIAKENTINNYGVIETTKTGQLIEYSSYGYTQGNTANNFGVIKTNNKNYAIKIDNDNLITDENLKNKGFNYGTVIVDTENATINQQNPVKIFNGDVTNNGIVILNNYTGTDLTNVNLGNKNNGLVFKKDNGNYSLINKDTVAEIKDNISDSNFAGKTTAYVTGTENKIESLSDKVIGTIVKDDISKTGAVITADKDLTLENTVLTGYFENNGTLLDMGTNNLTLLGDTKLVTSKDNFGLTNINALNINGTLKMLGNAEVAGKITGTGKIIEVAINGSSGNHTSAIELDEVLLQNATEQEEKYLAGNTLEEKKANNYTEIAYNGGLETEKVILDFDRTAKDKENTITFTDNLLIKGKDGVAVDGRGTTAGNNINLNFSSLDSEKIQGDILLGASNDDIVIKKNGVYKGTIDMGTGTDEFNVSLGAVETEHKKEAGNTFDYKVNGAEKIVLNGEGWHIGENAELNGGTTTKAGEKTELHIADKGSLHVDMNNNYGKGNVTTSLNKMASGADLSVTTGTDAEVKFVVGDKFNVSQKQFNVAENYSFKDDANITAAVIFKGTGENGAVEEKDGKVTLTVKDASDYNGKLDRYHALYDAMLAGLSGNEELKNAVNYYDEKTFVGMIEKTNNTAEAFYTTGYAVTKDVTDTYMSVVDDFGRKAGKGEWIAYGKYVNSDTEFDGGKASKGYDGDITGNVGMLEYGVNDTTSYGVVYGQGDTEVDIQGGGKLDGDNTYFGGYVKHRTQGGFDLTGNVGYTKSELDLNLATSAGVYNMITSGKSDADALTFALKGKKDYLVTDTVKLQPVFGARYTLINQDAVESSDANYRMDEQDVTIFEGILGGNAVKEFDLYNGKLSLSVGAEYVLADVSKSDDARYTLYGKEIALTGEEDIADNRIEGHIGIDYEHESGVGVDTKYEMIWTDKGDNSRVTAGISYRF